MTGVGDPDGAELAIRNGAWDYIEKPSSVQNMLLPLVRALQYRDEKRARNRVDGVRALHRGGIIGSSPQMIACLDLLAQAADSDLNVLIQKRAVDQEGRGGPVRPLGFTRSPFRISHGVLSVRLQIPMSMCQTVAVFSPSE